MDRRETQFLLLNRLFTVVYCVLGGAMIIAYALRKDMYHLAISLGVPVVPFLLKPAHRLLRLKPSQQLNFLILAFTFIAYPLGGCLDFYRRFPGFDKVAHMLSGTFVAVLCLALYCMLRPDRRIGKDEMLLAAVFTFLGSMAVAGLWEIGEYIVSGIVRMDLQRVNATGISDTMNDMIVCLIGTLIALPAAFGIAKDKDGILISPVRTFAEKNLPQ